MTHGPRCSHCEYIYRKSYHANYRKSDKRKESVKRDNDSPNGKARKRNYNKTEKGVAAVHKYHQTEKGKESMKKQVFIRRSLLKSKTDLPKGWQQLLKKKYSACIYCGSKEKLQIEHIYPIRGKYGGENILENIAMACQKCNQSKGKKLLEKWFEENPEKKRYFYSNPQSKVIVQNLQKFYLKKIFI